ncbi:MAG: GspH/FimT family protein [Patescibacteria group bacterium]|jgi:prepilin-type N-terminal cleavage/methylation domain-containing protein
MVKNFLHKNNRSKLGFSLTEMLIVISIIGIVSLISLPVYKNITPNIILNSSVRDMASDLRYAQQLAVTEQKIYSVQFNVLANSYRIFQADSGEVIRSRDINSQVKINSVSGLTSSTASFTVTGASLESGEISLMNKNGKINIIEIKPSGYVKIQN